MWIYDNLKKFLHLYTMVKDGAIDQQNNSYIYKNFIQHPLLTFSDYFDHEYFFEQPSFAVQVEYDIRNDILLICIKSSIPHFFSYKRYRNYNYKLCAIFELFYLQFPLRIGIFELSSHILTKTYFVQKLGRTTKITRMYFKIRIN